MFSFADFFGYVGRLLLGILLLCLPGGRKILAAHKCEDRANYKKFLRAKALINRRTDSILEQIDEKVRKLK